MRVAREYLISGRVQGVGYRWFAVDAARRDGIVGHVRNLPDGRVEIVAEGEADALSRFEAALWRGPSRGRVTQVVASDTGPLGLVDGFAIR